MHYVIVFNAISEFHAVFAESPSWYLLFQNYTHSIQGLIALIYTAWCI